MMNKSFGNLMNKALFLLSLFTFGSSISAMENNKPNPGDAAIKNHPNAWLATQVAGGATGSLWALPLDGSYWGINDLIDSTPKYSPTRQRLEQLKLSAWGCFYLWRLERRRSCCKSCLVSGLEWR